MNIFDPAIDVGAMLEQTLATTLPDFLRYCWERRDELDDKPFRVGLLIAVGGLAETQATEAAPARSGDRNDALIATMLANADRLERAAKRRDAENRPGAATTLDNAAQLLRDAAAELKLAAGLDEGA